MAQSKTTNILLWVAQILLAGCMIWAAYMKLLQPGKAAAMWPWTAQISPIMVQLTGVIDLLGGLGLVLPTLLRKQPRLTVIAAICVVLLMVCACVFHISRGETNAIGANIVFAALALFIARGRSRQP